MFREGIPSRQLSAWLAAAMIPVLIQLLGGVSWAWIILAGAGSVAAVWAVWRFGAREYPRWLCVLYILYNIVLLGNLLERVGASWPTGNQIAVPLILLALAAWSAHKGPSAAARVGCVLFWVVMIMYLVLFGAGVKDVKLQWLKPERGAVSWLGLGLLLLPGGAATLLRQGERWGIRLILPAVFTLVAALITIGVLSPQVARVVENPFYELSRSLNLLGIAERFEAVISAGMTVGWFALMSLLLSGCGKLYDLLLENRGRLGVWSVAVLSAVWLLCGLHIPEMITAVLVAVFWVVVPVLTQGIGSKKKS